MYTDQMDGLGKFKFKKLTKKLKKALIKHPFAPLPVKAMAMMKKKKKIAVAPEVEGEAFLSPVESETYFPKPMPQPYPSGGPYGGFYPQPMPPPEAGYYPQPMPVQDMMMRPYPQPTMKPYAEESAAILPADYFPTELDYERQAYSDVENLPMITPYESAAASTFGTEEDFSDTAAAYESEAGYLQGLGQEAGSTGGWFSDIFSKGAQAAIEIAKAKAAAKAGRVPAPIIPAGGMYRPLTKGDFGGFNLNTALMVGALGLGGFLLYNKFARKRR